MDSMVRAERRMGLSREAGWTQLDSPGEAERGMGVYCRAGWTQSDSIVGAERGLGLSGRAGWTQLDSMARPDGEWDCPVARDGPNRILPSKQNAG